MSKDKLGPSSKKIFAVIVIAALVTVGILTPLLIWWGRPCQISAPEQDDWEEAFTWIHTNLSANTNIAAWDLNGDYIHLYSNCTSLIYCGMDNQTLRGLVGRQFMASNESESVEILTALNTSYVLVSWSYCYPNGEGNEGNWQSMIQSAHNYLSGTNWEIAVSERWNESTYKPTCEFFNTTLWKMLTYGEPFIDSDTDEALIEALVQRGYPIGYFEARVNWADPWIPDPNRPKSGQWEDDAGHLWKYHNPPLGDGMIDDGLQDYDGNGDDDTVGQFADLDYFTPVFFSSGHLVKIYQINY